MSGDNLKLNRSDSFIAIGSSLCKFVDTVVNTLNAEYILLRGQSNLFPAIFSLFILSRYKLLKLELCTLKCLGILIQLVDIELIGECDDIVPKCLFLELI